MAIRNWRQLLIMSLLAGALVCGFSGIMLGQEASTRKVQTKVAPVYPELARRMRIVGVVKVHVTVAANGTVKDTKVLGGHPLLANAVMDAVRKWHYEASPKETTETLEFRFDPSQ